VSRIEAFFCSSNIRYVARVGTLQISDKPRRVRCIGICSV
jgi:hypothetical protein